MKLRTALCSGTIFAFSGCATIQEPCTAGWSEASRRLKSANQGLYDEAPARRLESAREFSKSVELIKCAESELARELQIINLAKYAILDASIGMLQDKDVSVRLASVATIRQLVLDSNLAMDRLSFGALLAGLKDESPEVRAGISEVVLSVCARQPGLCREPPEKTGASMAI